MRSYTKRMASIRERARGVAAEFRSQAESIDRDDRIPPGLQERLWDQGFMALRAPRAQGGGGATLVEAVVAVEELAQGSGAAGLAVLLQWLGFSALQNCPEEKKAGELIRRMVDRRETLAFALSEGGGEGFTTARKLKSEYIISGRKTLISGGRDCDVVILFAATGRAATRRTMSAFAASAGATGLLPGREQPRAGLRGIPASELVLSSLRLKAADRLGRQGDGYGMARRAITESLPLAAALACGIHREVLAAAMAFADDRYGDEVLAEMAASLDAARALTWIAASAVDEAAADHKRLARESKWVASEAAARSAEQAARLQGVEAGLRGSPLERLGRDARACQTLLGSNQSLRLEAASYLISERP